MSLHIAAQNMASKGRGPDDTLIHMSRDEVKSLNDLAMAHGGHLTTNPDTGLLEAGFLKRMLPMIIGAGLAATGVGAPMAALMVGGGYGAATGSLKKGLMAGLGAYGGAGLMGGLSAAGTAAAGAGEGLAGAAGEGLAGAAGEGLAGAAAEGVQVGAPIVDSANLSQTGADLFGSPGTPTLTAAPAAPVAAPAPMVPQTDMLAGMDRVAMENPAVSGFQAQNTGSMANAQRGLSGLMNNPASRDAFMTKMGGAPGLLQTGMMAAAPALMGGQNQDGYKGSGPNPYEYSYDYRTGSYTRQAPGYRDAQTVTPPRAMAMGGLTAFARGGQSHLGDYSDGGRMLRGPGDGVSDSIPATIGNKRPARLADGEFVVPARIVSELGNGSSEAGARKLYAMMDRVQHARKKSIGKNKVAVNSRAAKLLPA
jgi:hypothetical protein